MTSAAAKSGSEMALWRQRKTGMNSVARALASPPRFLPLK